MQFDDADRARVHAEIDCILLSVKVKRGPPLRDYDTRCLARDYAAPSHARGPR
jgi:hypothetical protein